MIRLWEQFKESSFDLKMIVGAIVGGWLIVLICIAIGLTIVWERSSQAQPSSAEIRLPTISLEPTAGPANTVVALDGQGWLANSIVLIYLTAPSEMEIPSYAVASVIADAEGRFAGSIIIPADPRWGTTDSVKVIARTMEGEAVASTFFNLMSEVDEATETPPEPAEIAITVESTATPPEPTATPTLVVSTPAPPTIPLGAATADLNVRSGPGTGYPILGLLRAGQPAAVTGLSPDGDWWQIKFSGVANERGWVSARYITAQNTANVPVVQPPAQPPKPTPVVISDWRGEYYNNVNLSGAPVVVRNDEVINFNWGVGAPVAGIRADNFSVRWARSLNFPAGTYRFYVRVDDGVRLWIDDSLVIDQWHDSAPTTYTVDMILSDGSHNLRIEYYERSDTALAQLTWEWLETFPDWKGEYFDNPSLSGPPVLVRNDLAVQFGWGPNSPGPDVPADNFSARWTRRMYFSAGTYRFKVLVDDGARLWVDDILVIDRWRTGEPKSYTGEVTLADGEHRLRLEYFDFRYDAQVRLTWERVDHFPDWKAEYYDNRKLQGNPVLVRSETKIDHKWGSGSPGPGVSTDNFSARWTRKVDFDAGTYRFQVKVDDGMRLWVDDTLVINDWQDGGARPLEADYKVSSGQHRLKVEYYERTGEARIEVKWQKQDEPVNQQPQADPGGPYTIDEGSLITFDGRGSRDPDGSLVNYEWDFNYDGAFTIEARGPTASIRYPDGPATIVIALRVTDDKGASHIAVTQVAVRNVTPTVEAGGPYTGLTGNLITLAGTAVDPGLIDQTGLSYRWEFGDGATGSGPLVSHSYTNAGDYTAKLTVSDKDGAQGSDTATVQVTKPNQPPQSVISAPTNGLVSETLNFSGSDSTDSDGKIVSYAWDFGDGAGGSGVNVSHSYSQAGSYQVTLTVIDNGGLTATAKHTVQISKPANQPPQAVINGPAMAQVDQAVEFDGSRSNDPDGNIVSYDWDFGDGATGSGGLVSHTYDRVGMYTVLLVVTDDGGLTTNTMHRIEIEPLAAELEVES